VTSRASVQRKRAVLASIESAGDAGLVFDGPGHRLPDMRLIRALINAKEIELRLHLTDTGRRALAGE
jgi:hypothetical protein